MIPMFGHQYASIAHIADQEACLYVPPMKREFVTSRSQGCLVRLVLDNFDKYVSIIVDIGMKGVAERRHFVSAFTKYVSSVFRELRHFVILYSRLCEWFCNRKDPSSNYLVCLEIRSFGEELLLIATVYSAILGRERPNYVRILASDIDQAVIERERYWLENPDLVQNLEKLPHSVASSREVIRIGSVGVGDAPQRGQTYIKHNLHQEVPIPDSLDAIFCVNVFIYSIPQMQLNVHRRLTIRLATGGLLTIDHSKRLSFISPEIIEAWRSYIFVFAPQALLNNPGKQSNAVEKYTPRRRS